MSERFAPKVPVQLDPPKDDPISLEELAKCDGMHPSPSSRFPDSPRYLLREIPNIPTNKDSSSRTGSDPSRPTLVAIKGTVFDVTRNAAYGATGQYRGESSMPPTYAGSRLRSESFARSHGLT